MKDKIYIKYGCSAAVLPGAVIDYMERTSKLDLKILIGMSVCAKMGRTEPQDVIELLGVSEAQLTASLEFWEKAGLIESKSEENNKEENTVTEQRIVGATVKRSDEVPNYTSSELSVILERRTEASHFIDECQRLMGKMFNPHDINIILGLVDYMGLEWDYVLAVAEYCGRIGKRSAKYAEKLAISMSDSGIDNAEALKIRFAELEALAENESKVRSLFGMKARALTTKEKKFIEAWFGKFGYGIEIVSRAYEITVNATGEASVPYTNAILERWNSEGLRTLEEVDASIEKNKKEATSESTGSFDTDDFFEAALKRSFNDKK